MTAPVLERTTAEVVGVQEQTLTLLAQRQEIPLTDLLTVLVRDRGHRVEIVSRALTALLADGQLTVTPGRTVKPS